MGRTSPLFGRSLHPQTSPSDTKGGLSPGEFPAITGPSVRAGAELEEPRRKELLW